MTAPTTHSTFTIERRLGFAPAKVYAAFATEAGKKRWFAGGSEWTLGSREFDFRVGGREYLKGVWPDGRVTEFGAVYQDIVPDRRIVYVYDLHIDGRRISISLATVEFLPDGAGTRLLVTEQGAFVDGYDDAGSRERGTRDLMERMAASLQSA